MRSLLVLCGVMLCGSTAQALDLEPVAGVLSLSSTEPAVGIGAKLATTRLGVGIVTGGVKTKAYALETQMASFVFRYSISKSVFGAFGAGGVRNYFSYTSVEGKKSSHEGRIYGPVFNFSYRPFSRLEIGIDYFFGAPGYMAILNTWAARGFVYMGVVF